MALLSTESWVLLLYILEWMEYVQGSESSGRVYVAVKTKWE